MTNIKTSIIKIMQQDLNNLILVLLIIVGSIPLTNVHACMQSKNLPLTTITENIDMPCHSDVEEQGCLCDDCYCGDLCGSTSVHNFLLDEELISFENRKLFVTNSINNKVLNKVIPPLIRPPIIT